MRDEMTREVEALTGRRVIAFMSDNHVYPIWRSSASSSPRTVPAAER